MKAAIYIRPPKTCLAPRIWISALLRLHPASLSRLKRKTGAFGPQDAQWLIWFDDGAQIQKSMLTGSGAKITNWSSSGHVCKQSRYITGVIMASCAGYNRHLPPVLDPFPYLNSGDLVGEDWYMPESSLSNPRKRQPSKHHRPMFATRD